MQNTNTNKHINTILSGCVNELLRKHTKDLLLVRGSGIYLYDDNDKCYIDAMSGAWVVNIGHGVLRIPLAGYKQGSHLAFVLQEGYHNKPALELANRILELSPIKEGRVFFCSGGSEAVDSALKLVRQYWIKKTGNIKYKVLCRKYSYHGATFGAMSVTGLENWKKFSKPLLPGAITTPHPYCYRCEFELTYPMCACKCIEQTEEIIQREDPASIGALIAEPICMSIGTAIPPNEYWPALRHLCDKYNILLIADEIITGFGRTGKWFGLDNWNIVPDIMVVGKGLTSGYAPLAAMISKNSIVEMIESQGFVHGYTYSGHPSSCAIANENISALVDINCIENASMMGDYLRTMLFSELSSISIIGDIRVYGLLGTIELKEPGTEKRPLADETSHAKLKSILLENGIICRVTNMIFLGPPLIINREQINDMVSRIKLSLLIFLDQI